DLENGRHGVEPAALRHANVEQEDVRPCLPDQLDDVFRALGVCDDLDVLLGLQDRAQALPEQRVVVHDHDAAFPRHYGHLQLPPPTRSTLANRLSPQSRTPPPPPP